MIVYFVTKCLSCPHHQVYLLQIVTISVVVTIIIIASQKIVKFIYYCKSYLLQLLILLIHAYVKQRITLMYDCLNVLKIEKILPTILRNGYSYRVEQKFNQNVHVHIFQLTSYHHNLWALKSSGLWFKSWWGRNTFPFFGPLVVSFRLGYLKAVSTSCWQTVSTSEIFSLYVFSSLNYSVVLKSN